jgi:Uncharacterised protein family UPF0047
VQRDLQSFFRRLVREDRSLYRHVLEGEDDMPAHIRSALTLVQVPFLSAAASCCSEAGRASTCSSTGRRRGTVRSFFISSASEAARRRALRMRLGCRRHRFLSISTQRDR